MSKIWDSLRELERRHSRQFDEAPQLDLDRLHDRRCAERVQKSVAVFVYGHSAIGEVFFESSELLFANAKGGLITLPVCLVPGGKLLLTKKGTENDQQCCVVGLRTAYLNRFAFGVRFLEPLGNFWCYEGII